MIVFKKANDLTDYILNKKNEGLSINFVPTMGALHQGHISLINRAKEKKSLTVCSIFINPTQFTDTTDFEKYPITIEKDIFQLEKLQCDVVFLPTVTEIYPSGHLLKEKYELGCLEDMLEGKFRPGHFQGVCQVVHRLLNIVQPDKLFLGQKDYQQVMVITKLVELLHLKLKIVLCPTLREPDGLAMSSRNIRLKPDERIIASKIFAVLSMIKNEITGGNLNVIKEKAIAELITSGFKVDYIEIADAGNLKPQDKWNSKTDLVALAAAYLNDVRLIDNLIIIK
jgi:pantoate--beta-alanine ligase